MNVPPEMARRRALQELQSIRIERPGEAPRILMGTEFAEEVARRPSTVPEVELAPSLPEVELAPSVPTRTADPTNPAYEYEPTAEGFRVFFQGREVAQPRRGTRAARSIESVLSGGAPLPRLQPRPEPEPEPEPTTPPPLTAMSDEELQRAIDALRQGR
jgi:hypothetical protein